jgi:uroporphyrinogen decarboxylase
MSACFDNLLAVLRREAPSRPTLFEFFLNQRLYERFGGPPEAEPRLGGQRLMLRAFAALGYDYATFGLPGFGFPHGEIHHAASISQNEGALVSDRASLERYPWPDVDAADWAALDEIARELPPGLKLIAAGPCGVLENAINLVGYEALCLLVYDDPALAEAVFEGIGARLEQFYARAAAHPAVGACIVNDDWGHKTQTMLPPAIMRRFAFPWHRRCVAAIHAAAKPAILHSCGARHEVMADILDMGLDGLHSYEDGIQPVEAAYAQWGGQIAILGGIDVDFLCRSTPPQIKARCQAMLDASAERGGYALGSGNSIPYYVPDESYLAMIGTITATR